MNSENRSFGSDQTRSFSILTPGMAVGHYRIDGIVGSGGMGEIYQAEDTKLKRKVALKFLPARYISDEDARARFVREAEAAARLNHPNVITIHEVSEFQGRPFIAMELLEGRSVVNLAGDKSLTVEVIVELAIQICEGLGAAHEKGVIHRDIKPSNIITDSYGRPKILDFGLATIQGSAQLTKSGSTLGTIQYMSPEQVTGKNVDLRSDLFSLGVVLYELITGRPPFGRDNMGATLKAILDDNPEPISRSRPDIPESLQSIVFRLLEKETDSRYSSCEDVIADLKGLTTDSGQTRILSPMPSRSRKNRIAQGIVTAVILIAVSILYLTFRPAGDTIPIAGREPVIAVLPFSNLGSPEDQYFADGMTEEITSRLAGIEGLGVISRTSAAKLRESDRTLREIGREYGVDFVLEGAVRWSKVGDQQRVRITPELIRVSDDRHLWAENYEQALIEVFAVQADIAGKIVEQLGLTLLPDERANLANRPTNNPEAYKFYLKALQKVRQRRDYSDSRAAQAALDSAVTLDPSFALAHALRSEAYAHGAYGTPDSRNGIIALEAAERALELDPDLPEGHLALGTYYYIAKEDNDRALEEFSRAKTRLSNDPELLHVLSTVQVRQGNLEGALENRMRAAELDPLNPRRHAALASIQRSLRRFDEADESIDRAIALEPGVQTYYEDKIRGLISHHGDLEEVREVVRGALEHCDTTEFVINNSELTLYIPELRTDAIIADFVRKETADTTKDHIFDNRPFWTFQHLDILENYRAQAMELIEWYDALEHTRHIEHLGLLYSFLGECDRAIESVEQIKETYSTTAAWIVLARARIYANCGKYEEAIDELDYLLSLESEITVNTLKFKPWIDPFRDHPRYQALVEKYAL